METTRNTADKMRNNSNMGTIDPVAFRKLELDVSTTASRQDVYHAMMGQSWWEATNIKALKITGYSSTEDSTSPDPEPQQQPEKRRRRSGGRRGRRHTYAVLDHDTSAPNPATTEDILDRLIVSTPSGLPYLWQLELNLLEDEIQIATLYRLLKVLPRLSQLLLQDILLVGNLEHLADTEVALRQSKMLSNLKVVRLEACGPSENVLLNLLLDSAGSASVEVLEMSRMILNESVAYEIPKRMSKLRRLWTSRCLGRTPQEALLASLSHHPLPELQELGTGDAIIASRSQILSLLDQQGPQYSFLSNIHILLEAGIFSPICPETLYGPHLDEILKYNTTLTNVEITYKGVTIVTWSPKSPKTCLLLGLNRSGYRRIMATDGSLLSIAQGVGLLSTAKDIFPDSETLELSMIHHMLLHHPSWLRNAL